MQAGLIDFSGGHVLKIRVKSKFLKKVYNQYAVL